MSDEKYKQRIASALNPFMKDGTPQNNLMKNLLNPKYVLTDKEVEMKFQLDKILEHAVNHFKLQNEVKNLSEKVFASEKNGTFDEKTFVENILNSKIFKGGKSRRKKRRTKSSKKRRGKRTRKQRGGAGGPYGECAICLGDISPQDDVESPYTCDHVFHVGCVGKWLGVCPLCRNPITPDSDVIAGPVGPVAPQVFRGIFGVQNANENLIQYSNDGIARIHPNEMVYDLPYVQGYVLINQQLDADGNRVNGQYRSDNRGLGHAGYPPRSEDLTPRRSDNRERKRKNMVIFFVIFSVVLAFFHSQNVIRR